MKQKKKETNPMFTKKGAWLWLVCAPLALTIFAFYESEKHKEKRRKRQAELYKDLEDIEIDWDTDEYNKH